MGRTVAERKKKQLDKLKKEGKYDLFKQNASEKQKERRRLKKSKMTVDERDTLRAKRREEQRQHRIRKKQNQVAVQQGAKDISPSKAYSSNRSLGRAVNKAKKYLPTSPRKKKAVVRKLALEYSSEYLKVKEKKLSRGVSGQLTEETQALVIAFYESDSVSSLAPGINDYVIIRDNGKKSKIQKRYLFLTLGETFIEFVNEHRDIQIGRSKFCSLRPSHVFLRADTPANVCLCIYHENVRLILQSIDGLPNSTSEFVTQVVCDDNNWECMTQNCKVCGDLVKYDALQESFMQYENEADDINYKQWIKNEVNHVILEKFNKPIDDVLALLKTKLTNFLQHVYIKRKQANHFKNLKENLPIGTLLMQMDFSENYANIYQDEIQSAHWSNSLFTLYTSMLYYRVEDQVISQPYVVISDYPHHNKYAVAEFNSVILKNFEAKNPDKPVAEIQYQSDGAAQHFKQKFSLCFITLHHLPTTWHFSATAHGKGPIDGIGGTLKRRVREGIKARQFYPNTAEEFAEAARLVCPNVNIIFIGSNVIKNKIPTLDKEWNPGGIEILQVPDTRTSHYFKALGRYELQYSTISDFAISGLKKFSFLTGMIIEDEDLCTPGTATSSNATVQSVNRAEVNLTIADIEADNWVVVEYDYGKRKKMTKCFVGQVVKTHIESQTVHVNFMKYDKDRQNFLYPEKLDSDPLVNIKDIKLKLPEPTFIYSRGLRATFPTDTGLYMFHNLN